jgi:hypothetical protein
MIKLDIQSVTTDLSVQAMCSTETKTIRKEDLDDEIWAWLDRQYRNTSDQVSMDLVSVVNAFLFQKRNVATITRDYVSVIVRGDKNWKKKRGYDNNRYKPFIALAIKTGIFEMIREGTGREPQIVRLRHPELVKALGFSPQQEQAWAKNTGTKVLLKERIKEIPDCRNLEMLNLGRKGITKLRDKKVKLPPRVLLLRIL